MATNKGKRFDLMEEKEWNTDWKTSRRGFNDEGQGKIAALESLTNAAKREFHEGNLKSDDIHKRIEHVKVDIVKEQFWTLRSSHIDPLISVLTQSFNCHKPIAFTPDLIYGYIAKGFARHIKKHAEDLRYLYVSHDGKKELIYRNDSFTLGSPHNPWELVFENFAGQLKENTKGTVVQNDLKFTTSTPTAVAHRNVLAMEAMESYFDYRFMTLCGIASVTLLGESSDWEKLYTVVQQQFKELNEFCNENGKPEASLFWWEPHVMSMLEKFRNAHQMTSEGAQGVDEMKDWLSRMLKYNAAHGSGAVSTVSGWINILFPYLKKDARNPWFLDEKTKIEPAKYPAYHASVPFKWEYYDKEFTMRAIVGHVLVGHQVQQDPDNLLLPPGTLTIFPAWIILHMDGVEEQPSRYR